VHFAGGLRGASIIDSLDTLYIMGLMDEYKDAKEWVETSLDLNSVRTGTGRTITGTGSAGKQRTREKTGS